MRHVSSLLLIVLLSASFAAAAHSPPTVDEESSSPAAADTVRALLVSLQPAAVFGQCSAEAPRGASAGTGLVVTANHCPYEGSFCYNGGFTCMAACRNCNMGPGLCPFGFCVCYDT